MALSLAGKTAFITGASRGIGLEIGKMLAARGANVAVAAKTADPNPKLPGTIHSAVQEIEQIADKHNNSAKGLAIQLDIRDADKVQDAIERTVERFGNLDIVINNASAINLKPTVDASPKSYDLMNSINARGTWLVSRYALPHLLRSSEKDRNPHVLTLSPPLSSHLFQPNEDVGCFPDAFAQVASAYAVSKLGMSIATFGLAAETLGKVACNCLWPYTLIGTSAMKVVSPNAEVEERRWRSPAMVAEAAIRVVQEDCKTSTANFYVDELYLRQQHRFSDEKIRAYSMGGPNVNMDDLAEDLFISGQLRKDIQASRQGGAAEL